MPNCTISCSSSTSCGVRLSRRLNTVAVSFRPWSSRLRNLCSGRFPSRRRSQGLRYLRSEPLFQVFSLSGEVSKAALWWEKDTDVWFDVSSALELESALRCPEYEICVVDWFATWCHGCRKTSPHLTELARDASLNKRARFIRACVDGMADYARRQGVKALPYVSIYTSDGEKLLGFGAAASKAKTFRENIETVLENPGKDYSLDPNGYAIALDRSTAVKKKKQIDRAVQELQDFKSKMELKLNRNQFAPASRAVMASESESSMEEDEVLLIEERKRFLDEYGQSYGYRGLLNSTYAYEFGMRLGQNEHYLDYTGSAVYTQTQLEAIFKDFKEHMFGNPHSENPSSSLSRDRIEEVRQMVLDYFDADPRQYQVIFTRSATTALKLVGETYPWNQGSTFRYLRENHNSVLGIRGYVLKAGASFEDLTEEQVDQWLSEPKSESPVDSGATDQPTYHLFAFPAEDNFAGVKYPLSWIEAIQQKSTKKDIWKIMLDAAAFVGTQPLSLRQFPADYVCISFYKMFGYPTGLGALLVKVDSIDILKKVFWAGGSVALATSHDNFHVLKCRPTERLEDGTVAFLDIISLKHGFDALQQYGGIESIREHVQCLTEWLYQRLVSLKHSNGKPLVKVFGKHGMPNSRDVQGPILNFELLGANGVGLSYKAFEREAAKAGFHIRTGNECNPGAAYNYLGIRESEVETLAGMTEGCDDELEYIEVSRPATTDETQAALLNRSDLAQFSQETTEGSHLVQIPLGSVRVSLGYLSTFEDCYKFAQFLETQCRDKVFENSANAMHS